MLARTKPPPWLPVVSTAVPALLLLVQIFQNWVNIPYWDEWGLIARLRLALQAGTLGPLDLFAQHNDSRFALPQLLLLPLAQLTHWDLRADMIVIFATVCAISVLLWSLFGKIGNLPPWGRVACLLVCNGLLFSPIQYETWLWGINLSLVLPPLLLLVSLRVNLSDRSLAAKIGLNVLLCFASTFSNANGMGNWLLAFPGFVQTENGTSRRWVWYGAYVAAAVGTLLLFFGGYQRQVGFSPLFATPLLVMKYFVCWLGAPLALSLGSSAWVAGASLLLIFIVLSGAELCGPRFGRRREIAYAFTAVGCYALLAGAAATLGRVGLEFQWALSSRYTTFSIYLPIGVVGLAALSFARIDERGVPPRKSVRKLAPALVVIAIFLSSLSTYRQGMRGMNWTRWQRTRGRAALLFSEVLPHDPDLKILSPDPIAMIRQYRALLRCGMARDAIISPRSIPPLEPRAEVDRNHGCLTVCEVKGGRLTMKGWAMGEEKKPAPFVLFAYSAADRPALPFAVSSTGDSTPWLIRHGFRNCGFRVDLKPDLPSGRVEISAWAVNPGHERIAQLAQPRLIDLPIAALPSK